MQIDDSSADGDGLYLEEVHVDANSIPFIEPYGERASTRTEITLTCIGAVPRSIIEQHGKRIVILPEDDWEMAPRAELREAQERIEALEREVERLIRALTKQAKRGR